MGIMDILKDTSKTDTEKLDEIEDTPTEDWGVAAELEDEPILDAAAEAEPVRDVVPTPDEVAKNRDRAGLRAKR